MSSQSGLTLLEVLVVLAIIAIIAAIATPSFKRDDMNMIVNQLLSDSSYAYLKSRQLGKNVRMCALNTQTETPDCLYNQGSKQPNWLQGWLLYVDSNNSFRLDAGDQVLTVFESSLSTDPANAFLHAVITPSFNAAGGAHLSTMHGEFGSQSNPRNAHFYLCLNDRSITLPISPRGDSVMGNLVNLPKGGDKGCTYKNTVY